MRKNKKYFKTVLTKSRSCVTAVKDTGLDKSKALEQALGQIEKAFGKGSIMRLGQKKP